MRVVRPDALLEAAADALVPVMDDVVVIGAAAIQIMLRGSESVITPTRDVDMGVCDVRAGERVVAHLEGPAGMVRSAVAHERGFTWVRGDLKVQVVRRIQPFVAPPVGSFPTNAMIDEAIAFREPVAFEGEPERQRLWVAGPAALVGLKELAFGRTRPDGALVERDYSDVVLLLEHCLDEIDSSCGRPSVMRRRVIKGASRVRDEVSARDGAIRQLVASGNYESELEAERAVGRIIRRAIDRLAA